MLNERAQQRTVTPFLSPLDSGVQAVSEENQTRIVRLKRIP
jgi:hypothetical protein